MSDLNKEALDVWGALKPMIDQEISSRTQGMVQRRKAKVTTAPSLATNTIGVTEAFGQEIFLPFVSNMISAKVGDFVWIEWMYGATNAFVSSFAAVDDKNLTVAGTLDVVQRRCYATLSSVGWYRVVTFDVRHTGSVIEFYIGRPAPSGTPAENHKISFFMNGGGLSSFVDETSRASTVLIDKIRLNYVGYTGYIDIHYTSSSTNDVFVYFNVYGKLQQAGTTVSMGLVSVADSPSGENQGLLYTFAANTSGTSAPTAGTYASVNTGSYVYRQGNIVYGQISMLTNSVLSSGGWRNLANISDGFRPNTSFDSFLVNNANDTPIHLRISTDGTVSIYPTTNIATGVLLLACFTYHCR